MRLSTEPARDVDVARARIHEALDAGVTVLDTASAYGLDEADRGHNERLIAAALRDHPRRGEVTVVTKAGMTRPGGRWVPDGRAGTILADAARSRDALQVDALDLLLLHAIDPKTKLRTSVRALRTALDRGLTRAVGLSNVTVTELRLAADEVPISAVSNAFSLLDDVAIRGGVLEHCQTHGITLYAHSPLGGPRKVAGLRRHAVLRALAARHDTTPEVIALAWLYGLGPRVVPIPGARTREAVQSAVRAAQLTLTEADLSAIHAAFPSALLARAPRASRRPTVPRRQVTVIMGMPGAGKTTAVERFAADATTRLNRDERGGKLRGLLGPLREALARDERVVLDNTYGARVERNHLLETAWSLDAEVRCVFLDTPLADAQVNVVDRMLERYGRLLSPEELRVESRAVPGVFAPDVQYRYLRTFERPTDDEGFSAIERVTFERRPRGARPGVLFDLAALRDGARFEVDAQALALAGDDPAGVLVWTPALAPMSQEAIDAALARLVESASRHLDVLVCTHPAGPATCWCRRPLPGLAVAFARRHDVRLDRLRIVSDAAADRTMAEALGARIVSPAGG